MRLAACLALFTLPAANVAPAIEPASVQLIGVGTTSSQPLYARWIEEYERLNPNVQIHYLPVGAGLGLQQTTHGEVDYGSADVPLTDKELGKASVRVLQFPVVLTGLVPIYSLEGVSTPIRFTPEALAGIYLGEITRWADPAIAAMNADVHLPNQRIVVVHSANGRGTAYVLSDYLCKVSPEWRSRVGRGLSIAWPTGTPAEGNGNVARVVKQTPGALGFVELPFAVVNGLPYGSVRNAAGHFVMATPETLVAAAAGPAADRFQKDFRVSLTNASGEKAYPIANFLWLLIPEKVNDPGKRAAMVQFLRWTLTVGQKNDPTRLYYVPLPAQFVALELSAVEAIAGR